MNWKKGHDTKIVSYHSIFSPYNQESATFQKCRNSRQSGCLPRVIGHLPSSQVTFHRFFLGLEACPILPWPFQPTSQHFRQRHYHLNGQFSTSKIVTRSLSRPAKRCPWSRVSCLLPENGAIYCHWLVVIPSWNCRHLLDLTLSICLPSEQVPICFIASSEHIIADLVIITVILFIGPRPDPS